MSAITIKSFRQVTETIGMSVEDVGSKPGVLDEADKITLNGQPLSYESALQTYGCMKAATAGAQDVFDGSPTKPTVTLKHELTLGRAMAPNRFVQHVEAAALKYDIDLTVRVVARTFQKDIYFRITAPKDEAHDFLAAIKQGQEDWNGYLPRIEWV